jgi:excisionase family DNA binding protein
MKGNDKSAVAADGFTTVQEAMAYLRLSRSAVYQLMESGQLAYAKFGKSRRIPLEALREFGQRNIVVAREAAGLSSTDLSPSRSSVSFRAARSPRQPASGRPVSNDSGHTVRVPIRKRSKKRRPAVAVPPGVVAYVAVWRMPPLETQRTGGGRFCLLMATASAPSRRRPHTFLACVSSDVQADFTHQPTAALFPRVASDHR